MNKSKLSFLIILFITPLFIIGQTTKDKSKTSQKNYVVKPFKQEKEGIYHYAVLTELPFENDCGNGLSEKEQIACSERNLRKLIYQKLKSTNNFCGNVYVYMSVTKDAEITDIAVKSYPNSESINILIKEATKGIKVKTGIYNNKKVISRLWTSFTFPSSSKELFSESWVRMQQDENPEYQNYENLIFEASRYIFSIPVYPNGTEFKAATKIVGFWMNKDTGINIPTFGDFFNTLTNKNQQQFLYTIAMINYGLNQKINHERILKCKKIEGQNYSEQEDVKEVQLGGAKILLEFIGAKENNVPMTSKTKKFYKAYVKGELEDKFFK